MATLSASNTPPEEPGKAYALESLCGEIYYIPLSRSAMRLLVTGKVSDGTIALVSTGGSGGDPIGFHYHREAHDVFLCLKGHVNVWANDQARTMGPGDYASVPPGVIHQYQILGDRSEFIGLIVPGGWEEFFRFLGEPYAGAMWPTTDDRNPFEVLLPKLKEAAERFDMVPQPQVQQFTPQPWIEGKDNVLPGSLLPYFLRVGTEPAYRLGGSVMRILATTKESGGKFAIGSIEGSSFHENKVLAAGLVFPSVHHAFHITEGTFQFHVDGAAVTLTAAETLYVPKGSRLELRYRSRYAKAYVFASGEGLVELFLRAGEEYKSPIIPEVEGAVDLSTLQQIDKELEIIFEYDLLTRHRRISCSTVTKGKPKEAQRRIRRACDSCAKAKVRCSSSSPCIRCTKSGIPCTRTVSWRSTDPPESDDAFLASQRLLDRSAPEHRQLQESHHINNSSMGQCVSTLATPLLSVDSREPETEPSPVGIPAANSTDTSMFDWPLQNCMTSQSLSMDFLDFLVFPGNGSQLDLDDVSSPYGAATERISDELSGQVEDLARNKSTIPSDSWHTYGGSGMVQPNLWERPQLAGSIEPGHNVSKAINGQEELTGPSKSILQLLSLDDILAIEDHGHVARVRRSQVTELSALIAKTRYMESFPCNPSVRELLNSPKVINAFVQLYFEYYHPNLPLLHKATFNTSDIPPLLILAVASIGCRFSKVPHAHTLSSVLRGILRKALNSLVEENIYETIEIPFAQAALLNQIQMAFDHSQYTALKTQFQRAMLITVCRGLNSRMRREDVLRKWDDGAVASSHDMKVSKWVDRELCRRLTYAIWLIDCQFSLHANVPPMMSLEDLDPTLPCPETLWNLNLAALSKELDSEHSEHNYSRTVRLNDALNPSKLAGMAGSQEFGLFSRVIAMTAIFYQWHTVTSINRYLLLQEPAEDPGQRRNLEASGMDGYQVTATENKALPSKPLVNAAHRAQWRTIASEAIRTICSNVNMWRESDVSQLTKLSHHISILFAVPLQPMCEYIGWMATKQCSTAARESLCAWLRADIQSARRAVMHAITLFCLVQRRKSVAHGENHHLFLAFLTIWTFFSLDPVARSTQGVESATEEDQTSSLYCIDCDGAVDAAEEEKWIQAPGHPHVRVSGVGNLAEPSGLRRILVETHRILLSDQVWGIGRLFACVLEGLISQGSTRA